MAFDEWAQNQLGYLFLTQFRVKYSSYSKKRLNTARDRPGPNKNTKQLLTDGIWWMSTKSVGLFIFNPVPG